MEIVLKVNPYFQEDCSGLKVSKLLRESVCSNRTAFFFFAGKQLFQTFSSYISELI